MGDRLLSWLDPTGAETPLNGGPLPSYRFLAGPSGLYAPPASIITQAVPMQPEVREKYVQVQPAMVSLPLLVQAETEADLDAARRALLNAMDPDRGLGTLRHTANDGAVRDLFCRVTAGLEGDESPDKRGPGWWQPTLQFIANEPFWHDTNFTQDSFATGSPVGIFDQPFLPIKLSSSGIASSFSVENTGNALAWPIWTLAGPGSAITLTNNTTGDVLSLSVTLTAGQSVTIDTSPLKKTVVREDGSKHFEYVSATSTLWPLVRGVNLISLAVTGATSATLLTLQYKQRYKGV